jgi:hypothetical protein
MEDLRRRVDEVEQKQAHLSLSAVSVGVGVGIFLLGQIAGAIVWGIHIDRVANLEIARNDEFVIRLNHLDERLDRIMAGLGK